MKKLISIVTPCFNEEENVGEVYQQVKKVFDEIEDYTTNISLLTTPQQIELLKS